MAAADIKVNRPSTILAAVVILFLFFYALSGRISIWRKEEMIKISELLSASIDLAQQGGKAVVDIRKSDTIDLNQLSKGKTKEGKDEFVTAGDSMSHEIITSGLKAGWPNLRYKSEENDSANLKSKRPQLSNQEVMAIVDRDEEVPLSEVVVWIDPLDATQEYTEGKNDQKLLTYVTVMVCIVVRSTPVAGVIYQAFEEQTYWGWVGHGVSQSVQDLLRWRSDKPRQPPKDPKIVISRSHHGDAEEFINKTFGDTPTRVYLAAGSGYKVLEVLNGAADAYFHLTLIKKWDLCAGNAVLYAANGDMRMRNGESIDYSLEGSPKNEHGVVATLENQEYFVDKLKEP